MKKICLVTGGSSGIGKAIAMGLARLDFKVFIIAKDEEELNKSCREITETTGNPEIVTFAVDLSSQTDIRKFTGLFKRQITHLDILINNAGVNLPDRRLTSEGIEYMFAVNHLAPFLLTNLLLDKLKAAEQALIINIASNGEKYALFDPGNLQGEKQFKGMKQYCITKLCNLMFSYELSRRLEHSEITCNAVHPGGVRTNIMKNYKPFSLPGMVWKILYPKLNKPEKVARSIINLITSGTFKDTNGGYFFNGKLFNSSPTSYDTGKAAQLWEISERLAGIKRE